MTSIRAARSEDVENCGRAIFTAYQHLADHHRFQRDFPSIESGVETAGMLVADPSTYGIVAEDGGRFLGCGFINVGDTIAGFGPFVVDPTVQDRGVGRDLMHAVMDYAAARKMPSVRFAQTAYNNRSLCLYIKLGFQAQTSLSVMQGPAMNLRFHGYDLAMATEADLPACNELCRRVYGVDRARELQAAVARGTATVVRHLDRVTGYATGMGFFNHAVAEDNQNLKALIAGASSFPGLGFLVPTENHDLLLWCLNNRMRLVMQMTLMSIGLYSRPSGAWLPSVLY